MNIQSSQMLNFKRERLYLILKLLEKDFKINNLEYKIISLNNEINILKLKINSIYKKIKNYKISILK